MMQNDTSAKVPTRTNVSTNVSAIKLSVLTIPQVMPAKSLCFVDFEVLAGLTLAQLQATSTRRYNQGISGQRDEKPKTGNIGLGALGALGGLGLPRQTNKMRQAELRQWHS